MKVGLIITTFNRPKHLSRCLQSLAAADLSKIDTVLIVDDNSTDEQTKQLINDFELPKHELLKAFSKTNRSVKGSLLYGCDLLFATCDAVINLDADAIVRKDFIDVLLVLKARFHAYLITGFNCLTKNRDGSERHKVIKEGADYNMKASVGGINMIFDKNQYEKWIRPSLVECLNTQGNWDHKSCLRSAADGKEIICAVPSVVQHIGVDESAMKHLAGGEPPDVAEDFIDDFIDDRNVSGLRGITGTQGPVCYSGAIILENVTLIAVDDDINGIIKAADISCSSIRFGAVKLLSSTPSSDSRHVLIRQLGSKKEYSQFLLKEVVDYVDTPYFIVFQRDGFILNPAAWDNQNFNYDYIGAVWYFRDHKRVGNGGFSFRSKTLHEILANDRHIVLTNDHIITNFSEDHNICYIYRDYLEEKYNIQFAPEDVADKFSFEGWSLLPPKNKYKDSFGFHGFSIDFNDAKLPYVPYRYPNINRKINDYDLRHHA